MLSASKPLGQGKKYPAAYNVPPPSCSPQGTNFVKETKESSHQHSTPVSLAAGPDANYLYCSLRMEPGGPLWLSQAATS